MAYNSLNYRRNNRKTRLCNYYRDGKCKYGRSRCDRAHGPYDYSNVVPPCYYQGTSKCGGKLCRYRHNNSNQNLSKTKMCLNFTKNHCDHDDTYCSYAHGSHDYSEDVELCEDPYGDQCQGLFCEYRHIDEYSDDIMDLTRCPYTDMSKMYITRENIFSGMRLYELIILISESYGYLMDKNVAKKIASYVFHRENFDNYFKYCVFGRGRYPQYHDGLKFIVKYKRRYKQNGIVRWATFGELMSINEDDDIFNMLYIVSSVNQEKYQLHSKLLDHWYSN